MHSGRPHRGDSGTSSGSTSLDVLKPTCSFAVGHHSCWLPPHVFVVVKDDKWFLDYSLSSYDILHAIIMKCADEYDILFAFHFMIICFLRNAATVSPFFSLALFTKSGNSFLLVLIVPTTSVFLVHKVSTSFGLVYQLSK